MSKPTVNIKEAKGRPMLTWVGKRALRQVTVFPAQQIETFDPTHEADRQEGGLLLHGDNKEVLAWLLANGYRGQVKLIYIDPPFDSGADYVRKVQLRGISGIARLDGSEYSLGEQVQYTDIWTNDSYLQFMYERLLILRELLSEDGSIFVHCDSKKLHHLRCLLEEIFSPEMFQSQIAWQRATPKGNMTRGLGSAYDSILFFAKSENSVWNQMFMEHDPEYVQKYYSSVEPETGRLYQLTSLLSPATDRPNLTYEFHGHTRVWRYTKERMKRLEEGGRVVIPKEGGMPREKRYLDEMKGVALQDLWTDISPVNSQAQEREDYPTQKPESLLERILMMTSDPSDIVLDCFIGSGTTAAVAQKLGRRWIACDINKGAIQTTSKRLQNIIQEQINTPPQLPLTGGDDTTPPPAQLSFSVYRVNDYDLQVQRNEAMQLAMEHTGITPTHADPFFDGTRGKQLAKIIPFERPLTLLDLEGIRQELENRPDETRQIVIVCLGKEIAVDAWLEDWNRLRKSETIPNKMEVIELRTDPRYGKFFVHEPAQARVDVARDGAKIKITIQDFISPSIVERLKSQAGLLAPQIDDWRAMVDSVMIDPAYDGQVFNIALADVPAKKDDLVVGVYELDAPDGETTVAIKITDMLGEEVLETAVV